MFLVGIPCGYPLRVSLVGIPCGYPLWVSLADGYGRAQPKGGWKCSTRAVKETLTPVETGRRDWWRHEVELFRNEHEVPEDSGSCQAGSEVSASANPGPASVDGKQGGNTRGEAENACRA